MKKLYRSKNNRKIAGICGGLGELFSFDPTLIRLLFVFIDLVTGILPLIVVYIVGWIILPTGPPREDD
ncbi:phage-shock protein [candidate division WOR_3 bacterium SM23_60]|uniref:Phage-shock protein n=1 Tax=candidate division WOR_3 bacterium SM23_60 TaxID=1703780 RepID=A0A0S8GMY3_UNCW3|nr:MAG: phage-shock protein [candidate division WOR_3 bacterium SM23_60]